MPARHEPIRLCESLLDVRIALPFRPRAQAQSISAEQLKARYDEGVRDGEKALREQLLQQRKEVQEVQQGLLKSLSECLPQLRRECESTLVAIALEAAQKLVGSLPISSEMISAVVKEALSHCEATQGVVVQVHPEDLNLLQRINAPVLATHIGGEAVRFEPSPEVTRGGCLVQSHFGVLDARRETKFEVLKKSLLN
jgi:flagellar assembly protein FliH